MAAADDEQVCAGLCDVVHDGLHFVAFDDFGLYHEARGSCVANGFILQIAVEGVALFEQHLAAAGDFRIDESGVDGERFADGDEAEFRAEALGQFDGGGESAFCLRRLIECDDDARVHANPLECCSLPV